MSKEILMKSIKELIGEKYSWILYFLKIDFKNENPYYVYKYEFKNSKYLSDYIEELFN